MIVNQLITNPFEIQFNSGRNHSFGNVEKEGWEKEKSGMANGN
jgi:hypothetical protein